MHEEGKWNSKRLVLSERDIKIIERIYIEEWDDMGVAGGAETWFRVIQRFLGWAGYDIVKVRKCPYCGHDKYTEKLGSWVCDSCRKCWSK